MVFKFDVQSPRLTYGEAQKKERACVETRVNTSQRSASAQWWNKVVVTWHVSIFFISVLKQMKPKQLCDSELYD